jgi:collagen type III alpha
MPGVGTTAAVAAETHINAELLQIPQSHLHQLKQEAGVAAKDLPLLTLGDKVGFCASSRYTIPIIPTILL